MMTTKNMILTNSVPLFYFPILTNYNFFQVLFNPNHRSMVVFETFLFKC